MTDTLQRNVVNLNQFDRSRKTLTAAEALALLHACRDQTIEAVCHAWQEKGAQVEDSLLAHADQSPTLETRNLYYAAQGIVHNRGDALTLALRKHFIESFERQIRNGGSGSSEAKPGGLSMELALVDEEDFEQSLALSKAAARLRFDSIEELAALDQRISALLHDPQARDERNPLGAKTVCQAFLAACEQLEVGSQIKLVLLQQFGQKIARDLPKIYQQLNQFLVGKDILPSIRVGLAGHKDRPRHTTGSTGMAQTETASQQDIFTLLQQLVGRAAAPGSGGVSPPAGGALPAASHSSAASPISALTHLQHGVMGTSLGAMPGFDTGLLQSGTANILRDIRAAGLVMVDSHVDAFTIDIVAMLFDYIFDDRTIPDKLKALIGRLQIPVLKVAMLDKQFFSKKAHPARRLLDEIAAASIGWHDAGEYNTRLFDKLDGTVQSILADFSEDVGIFTTLLDDLLEFLATHRSQTESAIEQSAQNIQAAERAEIAKVVVADEIRRVSAGLQLPDTIREFLDGPWQQVLSHAFAEQGAHSQAWKTSLQTMQDLVWSVKPKRNTEDRLSLVIMLPDLLKHLREGMNSAQIDPTEREVVFSRLVTCHAAAVKAGLQLQQELQSGDLHASAMADSPAAGRAAPTETGGASLPVSAERFELDAADDDRTEDEYTNLAHSLKKGDWLEFHNDDGMRLARLSWVSSMRGIYLFTNNEGMDALTIALPRLAARLRDKEARIVEAAPLTERAVEKLILNLQNVTA
ncbi:hypothetical protein TPL01_05740 [Sulfuriferula plumbiphila]|uniref:Thymidine phosphorylase n=1 Tax=Sulfuriferula plumbiphila TaxID=171865 RepID=A0A512L4N6_9PROT|nr:DUF1631 domain-containing protein [Sulfuriferula plumbiphila]BBP03149.1 hypothetical protein SFPGR_05710 [Sulfuriferula plumbiphila]GEP29436.1 hypothetical protein TPL01_05740 [Sulfuriferula plumbiphila]